MNRLLLAVAGGVGLAIVALLVYSLDRTAWLFTLYEGSQPHAAALGLAAAIVVELAAVALIAGDGVAESLTDDPAAQRSLRAWAGRGLAVVLVVQALANLIAGYVRGGPALVLALESQDAAALAIGGVAWLVTNAAVPGLIFLLAKIESQCVRLLLASHARRTEDARLKEALEQTQADLAQTQADLAQERERAAQTAADLAQTQADRARLAGDLAQVERRAAQLASDLAQAQQAAVRVGSLDLVQIARLLRLPREAHWREIEEVLGVPHSTLRGQMEARAADERRRAPLSEDAPALV